MTSYQTSNIKHSNDTEYKPRSIRLTKAHREDIVDSVMKQWDVVNPKPVEGSFLEFIRQVFASFGTSNKRTPHEFRALSHVLENTRKVKEYLSSIPDGCRGLVKAETEKDFIISVILEDGSKGSNYFFALPKVLADKWKIPYLYSKTVNFYREPHIEIQEFCKKSEDNNLFSCEVVYFSYNDNRISIAIPHDFPALEAYKQDQKKVKEWADERHRQREEVLDYLNQYNTTNQLRENWPEVVPYLPAHIADPDRVIKLPALAKSRLNERLGL